MNLSSLILLITILVLIIGIICWIYKLNKQKRTHNKDEKFEQRIGKGRTKCFSCSNPDIPDIGNSTRCFSCERQMMADNVKNMYQGQPTKCFTCDKW